MKIRTWEDALEEQKVIEQATRVVNLEIRYWIVKNLQLNGFTITADMMENLWVNVDRKNKYGDPYFEKRFSNHQRMADREHQTLREQSKGSSEDFFEPYQTSERDLRRISFEQRLVQQKFEEETKRQTERNFREGVIKGWKEVEPEARVLSNRWTKER